MSRRALTEDWTIELDDAFQGEVIDGSLRFVSPGPPTRTVWVAAWNPPAADDPADTIGWARDTSLRTGPPLEQSQVFEEHGADEEELRYARWYYDLSATPPHWSLYAYTARRGALVQAAFLLDDGNQLGWALDSWRSLRHRNTAAAQTPQAAPAQAVPAQAAPAQTEPAHAASEPTAPQPTAPPVIPPIPAPPAPAPAPPAPPTTAERAAQTLQARRYSWGQLGQLDQQEIAHVTSESAWPTPRQGFIRVRRGAWTVLASDGLSDTSDTAPVGLGLEVFVETDDPALTGPLDAVPGNWAMQLLRQGAQAIAKNGRPMVDWLAANRVGTIELPAVVVPPGFTARAGNGEPVVGALLGAPLQGLPEQLTLPAGQVRLLAITILTARETEYLRTAGPTGRDWLVGALGASGPAHRSTLARPSLI